LALLVAALGIGGYGYYAAHKGGAAGNTAQTLPAPTNLRVEGNVLRWDAVDNAIAYAVAVNGNTDAPTYDTATMYGLSAFKSGVHTFAVRSVGGGEL
jgi:hypothetical protein